MRFVITGASRSGTTYAAELLTVAGLACGHEAMFHWDNRYRVIASDSERFEGDSSYVPAPIVDQLARQLVVIHLVRPPLDMIRSVVGIAQHHPVWQPWIADVTPNPWVRFVDRHAGVLAVPAGPQRAATYWLRWNELIGSSAHLRWPLPDITADSILELAELISLPIDPEQAARAMAVTPRDVHHRERDETVTLDDLGPLAGPVAAAAAHYHVPFETAAAESGEAA